MAITDASVVPSGKSRYVWTNSMTQGMPSAMRSTRDEILIGDRLQEQQFLISAAELLDAVATSAHRLRDELSFGVQVEGREQVDTAPVIAVGTIDRDRLPDRNQQAPA